MVAHSSSHIERCIPLVQVLQVLLLVQNHQDHLWYPVARCLCKLREALLLTVHAGINVELTFLPGSPVVPGDPLGPGRPLSPCVVVGNKQEVQQEGGRSES